MRQRSYVITACKVDYVTQDSRSNTWNFNLIFAEGLTCKHETHIQRIKHTTTHQMGNFTPAIIAITSLWSLPHNSSSICGRGAWWLRSRHKVHAGWHEVSNLDSSSNLASSSAATIKFEFNYLAIPTGCELIQHKNGRQKVQVRGCIQYNN